MQNNTIVRIRDLVKTFHGQEIISHCNMNVRKGTVYGFLGQNGAGKTTVLKLLMGLLHATSGQIEIDGIHAQNNHQTILKNIGSVIETPMFYEHMTAAQNLEIHLSYMELPHNDIDKTLHLVGLNSAKQPVSEFSLGMRQRLGIARAIIHKPKLLLLDEPINGLDPMGIRNMRELFISLVQDGGMTIIISSHILGEIEHIADTIGVIVNGSIVQEIALASIKETYPNGLEDYFFTIMNGGTTHA